MSDHADGFGSSVGWGDRPAVLIIDMMRAYFTVGSPMCLPDRDAVVGCAALLGAARTEGIPVIHTRVAYTPNLSDGGLFVRKIPALANLVDGAPLGRFEPGVEPHEGELVITKQYASAFFGTSLAATLTAAGTDTLVIGGVSTSGCIRASATDAIQHGFRPIVVSGACGDRTATVHDANLFDLAAKYADVIELDAALAGLRSRGSTGDGPILTS